MSTEHRNPKRPVLQRPAVIAGMAVLALLAALVFLEFRVPKGVAPKSGQSETIALVSLATAVVSLITALVGLVQKIVESRKGDRQ